MVAIAGALLTIGVAIVAHELTHSAQAASLGNGWRRPYFWPNLPPECQTRESVGCVIVGPGFEPNSFWLGEGIAYAVQFAVGVLGMALTARTALRSERAWRREQREIHGQ